MGTLAVIDEILQEAGDLCRHNFGHHVIEAILENGDHQQLHSIAASLHFELQRSSLNRNAIYVFERALVFCADADKHSLAVSVLRKPQEFVTLAENQFGCNVARAVIRLSI